MLHYIVEQIATVHILEDEIDVLRIVKMLDEATDIFLDISTAPEYTHMVETLTDVDLSLKELERFTIIGEAVLGDLLHQRCL